MTRRRLSFVSALLIAFAASPVYTQATTWQIDPVHTATQFGVKHMTVSTVRGQFTRTTGTVVWDGKNPSSAVVSIAIDAASIDTHEPARDNHLRSPDLLDVAKYPNDHVQVDKGRSRGSEQREGDGRSHDPGCHTAGRARRGRTICAGQGPGERDARRRVGHHEDQPEGLRPDLEQGARRWRRGRGRRGGNHDRRRDRERARREVTASGIGDQGSGIGDVSTGRPETGRAGRGVPHPAPLSLIPDPRSQIPDPYLNIGSGLTVSFLVATSLPFTVSVTL